MRAYGRLLIPAGCLIWVLAAVVTLGQTQESQPGAMLIEEATPRPPRPLDPELVNLTSAGLNRADEPFAAVASLAKTREFLDEMALSWTRYKKCGTCHTNIPFMFGRAVLGPHTPASEEVRGFFVDRAKRWDSMDNLLIRGEIETSKGWGLVTWFPHEVIVTAMMFAMDDAHTTGTLQPLTREVLDRMWALPAAGRRVLLADGRGPPVRDQ